MLAFLFCIAAVEASTVIRSQSISASGLEAELAVDLGSAQVETLLHQEPEQASQASGKQLTPEEAGKLVAESKAALDQTDHKSELQAAIDECMSEKDEDKKSTCLNLKVFPVVETILKTTLEKFGFGDGDSILKAMIQVQALAEGDQRLKADVKDLLKSIGMADYISF
mmetsp:Transcript_46745/g.84399  ORF Transcript_46745/g.84399 Transcript_46745/m.84399 type:complete len:168 (-) Transcript_46745:29-532(-)|eukprot:CAMPEP_0197647062 /NCGR_PEP_ID=MMETSP1338-20131121/24068_1 /TAXON_ID=43686 ORGANISM="Pelagodinium beii, Strain RCC1491" /NCGR_SAMPLE_ID=MMETSP1338 /ASSEMBLY_ACC=CAM_ASM_000754 /LENGTH=167 /DNA_ID=CAMNT_0043220765 /DNA_START=62 /DNA_END=565 /DNA_ORIENTATION=+